MPDLCSAAGHGGAGIVDGPDLDGGVLGHADQLDKSCKLSITTFVMPNLSSNAGHGGAGIVDGPDLDGGVLGHADQPADTHGLSRNTFVMSDLSSDAGHGGAGIVDGPDLDGGVLGHADQAAAGRLGPAEGQAAQRLRVTRADHQAGQRAVRQPPDTDVSIKVLISYILTRKK
jgi:hypothetical protein